MELLSQQAARHETSEPATSETWTFIASKLRDMELVGQQGARHGTSHPGGNPGRSDSRHGERGQPAEEATGRHQPIVTFCN